MEQNTEIQDRSYAQQLVDEYYGNYEKVKPSESELPNILGIFEFMLDKFYYHNGVNLEPIKDGKMTVERIKEIQSSTGYPDSVPVQQALLQVWNEVAQESNQVQAAVMPNEEIGGGYLTDKEFETLSIRITPSFYDIDLDGATNCKGDVLRKLRIIINDIIDSRHSNYCFVTEETFGCIHFKESE